VGAVPVQTSGWSPCQSACSQRTLSKHFRHQPPKYLTALTPCCGPACSSSGCQLDLPVCSAVPGTTSLVIMPHDSNVRWPATRRCRGLPHPAEAAVSATTSWPNRCARLGGRLSLGSRQSNRRRREPLCAPCLPATATASLAMASQQDVHAHQAGWPPRRRHSLRLTVAPSSAQLRTLRRQLDKPTAVRDAAAAVAQQSAGWAHSRSGIRIQSPPYCRCTTCCPRVVCYGLQQSLCNMLRCNVIQLRWFRPWGLR
jgi:hypothetical protein